VLFRKVGDLQFTIEEISIEKADMQVANNYVLHRPSFSCAILQCFDPVDYALNDCFSCL